MIPEIGFMVGCYIITKLAYISGRQEATTPVKIFSMITVVVTMLVCADLFIRGLSGANGLK
jgi:hypothetical protein